MTNARQSVAMKASSKPRAPYSEPDAITNAVGYARFYSRSHDAVIRVYDEADNVLETHEHAGDFKEWWRLPRFRNDSAS
jgi:hypothetical protein